MAVFNFGEQKTLPKHNEMEMKKDNNGNKENLISVNVYRIIFDWSKRKMIFRGICLIKACGHTEQFADLWICFKLFVVCICMSK